MKLKPRKGLLFGVSVLLVVVVLWVGSAALSRYLYTKGHYNKPFFTTYFKTSLLSIYLIAFIFWRPWHRLCCCGGVASKQGQLRNNDMRCEDSARDRMGPVVPLRRRRDEERRALLDEDEEAEDDEGGGRKSKRTSKVVCVKITAGGMEEVDEFASMEYEGAEKVVWSMRADGGGDGDEECGTGDGEGVAKQESGRGGSRSGLGDHGVECRKACPIPIVEGSDDKLYLVGCLKSPDRRCPLKPSSPVTSPPVTSPPATSPPATSPPATSPPATSTSSVASSSIHLLSSPNESIQCRGDNKGVCPAGEGVCPAVEGACPAAEGVCPVGERTCPVGGVAKNSNCPFMRYYKLKTCTLGPPECRPLCCELVEGEESDKKEPGAVPPCRTKCCKVSFCSQVEVRELMKSSGEIPSCVRKFDRRRDVERHARSLPTAVLPVHHHMILSLVFGIIWFFANYLYSVALSHTSVAMVNTMSATSGVFVMVLAGLPCLTVSDSDKFTIPRCMVTLVSVFGAVLVAYSVSGQGEDDAQKKSSILGAVMALGGSMLYALYLVLLRRFVKDTDSLEIPMFFGFVGLFDFLLLLPVLVLWHFANVEAFEIPPTPNTWTLLLVNGLAGTVLSELLWLW